MIRSVRPTIVYVSGPITTGGNVPVNVRRGIEAAVSLMDLGYVAICPHEKAFGMEMLSPRSYEEWMEYDFRCIEASDAVFRMPGESVGGDREVEYAVKIGVPVYYSLDMLTLCEKPTRPLPEPPLPCFTCGRQMREGENHAECR